MIDLSGAQPPWPAEAHTLWQDCFAVASREASLWTTPAPQGDELLREQIGSRFDLDPQFITITSGIRATALTYARVHRVIHLERPTFAGVLRVLEFAGARVEHRSWEQLHSAPRTGALWVTSPHRNPDGVSLDPGLCELLVRRAADGQRVVVNGAYLWFTAAAAGVPGADLLGSFHKIMGHGARLGWVCGPSYFEEAVAELLGTTPSPVWQRAVAFFAMKGGLDLLAVRCVAGARTAAEAFAAESGAQCTATPHLLLRLAAGITEQDALARLAKRGFRVSPGSDFGSTYPALRVSFLGASSDDAAGLARAISETQLCHQESR